MTKRISSPCVIVYIMILGIFFLITPSSHAQGTSASSEQKKIAHELRLNSFFLEECDEAQSRVANKIIRETLEKRYQDYLQKLDLEKKSQANFDKAKLEWQSACKAYDEAHNKFLSMSDKCEKAVS